MRSACGVCGTGDSGERAGLLDHAGKVNPTQCEALTMIAVQVMANDVAVGFGGAGGYLEMNVYKPLIIFNITHSIVIMTDGCVNFRKFLIGGHEAQFEEDQGICRSLLACLVTALAPVIRLRQGLQDRSPGDGQRSHAQGSGASIGLCDSGRIRSRR